MFIFNLLCPQSLPADELDTLGLSFGQADMVKVRKRLFGNGYVISEEELVRLNSLLCQIELLDRYLASDERSQIILNALILVREGIGFKDPSRVRDEIAKFDNQKQDKTK